MKESKTIWKVLVGDKNYPNERKEFLLRGEEIALISAVAIKMGKLKHLKSWERPSLPYIRAIDLVGELDN